jgi:DTW domain-containing protein YfiP
MSSLLKVDYDGRHKAFADFKQDIEARLEAWLLEHPVEPQKLLTTSFGKNMIVKVMPSAFAYGGWIVHKNGEIMETFTGDNAWADATSYGNRLLNPNSEENRRQ